jgi:hypothetical protein
MAHFDMMLIYRNAPKCLPRSAFSTPFTPPPASEGMADAMAFIKAISFDFLVSVYLLLSNACIIRQYRAIGFTRPR